MKKIILIGLHLFSFAAFSQGDIYLSVPTDGELIEEKSINFVWQASSLGSQEDPRLSQDLVVSLMNEDQSPFEALEVNQPIINRSNIIGSSYYVSNSNFPFEEGKKYAWQIRYYMNGVLISRSEAWWFEMGLDKKHLPLFIPLRTNVDGGIYFADKDYINVSIVSTKNISCKARIKNENGIYLDVEMVEIIGSDEKGSQSEGSGTELKNFTLPLKKLKLKKGLYQLEWKPSRGDAYTLLFQI